LFRALNELKKNGVLGREIILRKTMLDECKGDKLLEILAVFSTAVVKRVTVPGNTNKAQSSVSLGLATATILTAAEQGSLLPLAIAHRGSLGTLLRQKDERKSRCLQFGRLLNQKVEQLTDRLQHCAETKDFAMSAGEEATAQRQLRENWPGNSKWPQTLLYGDQSNAGDLPLKKPFREVWRVVASGGTLESDPASIGLVESLGRRVSEQKVRLHMWQTFHKELRREPLDSERSTSAKASSGQTEAVFDFQKHQRLQNEPGQFPQQLEVGTTLINSEYDKILSEMRSALVQTKPKVSRKSEQKVQRTLKLVPEKNVDPPISALRTLTLSPGASTSSHPRRFDLQPVVPSGKVNDLRLNRIFSPARPRELNNADKPPLEAEESIVAVPLSGSRAEEVPEFALEISEAPKAIKANGLMRTPSKNSAQPGSNGSSDAAPVESHHEEDLANDIISAIMNAPDSAIKGQGASPTEHTRKSMFLANSNNQQRPELGQVKESREISSATSVIAAGPSVADRRATLLERTQQSISGLQAHPRHNARKSLAAKKQRQSILFPVNQFETPGKLRPEPVQISTPPEKLYGEQADYASVFKSRPKVKVSPLISPSDNDGLPTFPEELEEEEDDMDDMDGDGYGDLDGDSSWIRSSPLRGRG
jgi:hypothetical protein